MTGLLPNWCQMGVADFRFRRRQVALLNTDVATSRCVETTNAN